MTDNQEDNKLPGNLSKRNVGQGVILPYVPYLVSARRPFWLVALILANALLLAPDGSLPRVTGALALLLLPGLGWAQLLFPTLDRFTRWVVGLGFSYTLVMLLGLLLHYFPGPIPIWMEIIGLNALIIIPILLHGVGRRPDASLHDEFQFAGSPLVAACLALVLVVSAVLRFVSLGYSEFQGDEALAMIAAAEALEGHQDALFWRGKGPGEVLLPMGLWRLTGTVDETTARLPFAISGLLATATIYLLARRLFGGEKTAWGKRAALLAAGLLALNGFMVGFSRIVQYQSLVVWMSGLALLSAWEWRARARPYATRWAALCGAFVGAGLLAHYDAILVAPAIAYMQLSDLKSRNPKSFISALLIFSVCLLLVAGIFYVAFTLDPQAARTGGYLSDRIGDGLLKNNLDGFLRFNIFYNSAYYVIITGILVLGYLTWALRRAPGVEMIPGGSLWLPGFSLLFALGLALRPHLLRVGDLDLAGLPFTFILLGVFLSASLDIGQRVLIAWLAVPFLGYNFAVALPLTHIYTIMPAWTMLGGLASARMWAFVQARTNAAPQPQALSPRALQATPSSVLLATGCVLLTALFGGYLYIAYLRHDIELWQDWPAARPALYWSPYADPPATGFFGFPHRTGWKPVGALYTEGFLAGDYGSNEEPDVTTWYTRGAPRACDLRPEYYLIADDLIDPWPVDEAQIQSNYTRIGRISLPNDKGLSIYQALPAATALDPIQINLLNQAYDRSATPSAFARSAQGSQPKDANLGGLVRLLGFDMHARRAWPGGRLAVTLYWQAQSPLTGDYHVFVHLEGDPSLGSPTGIWGQADGRPVCWTYPTFDWRPGQIIADQHAIHIQPDTPAGEYVVRVGMYRPDTDVRLEILDQNDAPVANFVELAEVAIQEP